jgi:glycosyltransferase involved in cell wall biosynthesis
MLRDKNETNAPAEARRPVVTSHPGKQAIVYDTVVALQLGGMLERHIAAVYYIPDRFPYTMLRWLPPRIRERIVRELEKRREQSLDERLISSFPFVELLVRFLEKIPVFNRLRWHSTAYRITFYFHDLAASRWLERNPAPRIFLGFQGSALRSLRTARKRGAIAVLNSVHPLSHDRIVAEEYGRLGFKYRHEPVATLIREARNADYWLTASEFNTNSLIEIGIPRERIIEFPFGIDVGHFSPRRAARNDSVFRVLFVGKVTIHKGFHYLLDAWKRLSLPDTELVLVGRTIRPEDRLLLQRYDPKLFRLVPEVHDVAEMYASAHVFVQPSLVEGFGMVTLEAMASGLPVITTDHAIAVVRDGVDGYVVPIRDSGALADRLRQLYEDRALRESMGREARSQAERFTLQRYYATVRDVIDSLANEQTVSDENRRLSMRAST